MGTQAKAKEDREAKVAVLFRINLDGEVAYFLKMDRQGETVHGFKDLRAGLDYFERGYREALRRGGGFVGGLYLYEIQMLPRVFHFGTLPRLKKMLGLGPKAPVETIRGTGIYECGIRLDPKKAEKVYAKAVWPSLAP